MHRRLQIGLTIDTQAKAIAIRDAIKSRLSFATDVWKNEDAVYKKNLETSISTDMDGKIIVSATYLFINSTKAETVFNYIKNNIPAGVHGLVSLHYCPAEGEIKDWQGCKNDPRADYKEVNF